MVYYVYYVPYVGLHICLGTAAAVLSYSSYLSLFRMVRGKKKKI